MAYSHGGGAFLIPYVTALATAGIPLLILEFGMGHERIGSAPLACHKIRKNWEWLGWWAVTLVMFGIELYYSTIISWCLNFFFLSMNYGWGNDPNTFFFRDFLAMSKSPSDLGQIRTPIFFGLIIVWFFNWMILYRGVRKGVELANKIFMPVLFTLTALLVCWSLTLDGAMEGIEAYLTPDFSCLSSPQVWIDAYSQIFFTLSLGFGIMIAYASYLPRKSNITRNALLTGIINSGYSIFAGLAVFSVLGFMAASEQKPISDVVSQSIGLAFVAYPKAMSIMPGGNLFGAVFFLCLFVAGLSSSVSIIEAFTSAIMDKFGTDRKFVVTPVCVIGCAASVVFTTQAGIHWLDILDHFLTNYGLVVVGMFECILVGWLFKLDILRKHVNRISSVQLGTWWNILIKYFIPSVLVVILAGDIYGEFKESYGGYSWASLILIGRDWLLLTLFAGFWISLRPWKTGNNKGPNRGEVEPVFTRKIKDKTRNIH